MSTPNKIYWVVESQIDGTPTYFTGVMPSTLVADVELQIKPQSQWTTDIHQAKKYESKGEAETANVDLKLAGEVTEHMDVLFPNPEEDKDETDTSKKGEVDKDGLEKDLDGKIIVEDDHPVPAGSRKWIRRSDARLA